MSSMFTGGKVEAEHHFGYYALFVSFFPQLVAGPIERAGNLLPQLKSVKKFEESACISGLKAMLWGYYKKIVVADTLAVYVNQVYGNLADYEGLALAVAAFFFSLQIYCDFSGYSDIAAGTAKLLGIDFMDNFAAPYFAASIQEFWKRWHISLSAWFRDYVYIPLGGSRCPAARRCRNLLITFLASGIWHGADWTFVLWGILHGVFSCFDRLSGKWQNRLGEVTRWAVTFMLVNMLWILFRADDIASAKLFIARMCSLSEFGIRAELYQPFQLAELVLFEKLPFLSYLSARVTGLELWVFLLGAFFVVLNLKNSREAEFHPTPAKAFVTVLFVSWSVFSLSGISSFLYFDF